MPDYVGGLLKGAARLSRADERKQMLQFAGLGAAAYPTVTAVGNLVQGGGVIPSGASPKRWLASQMVKGTLLGGAIPAARHFIGSSNIEHAKRRAEAARTLKELAPGGVREALETAKEAPIAKANPKIPLSKVPPGVVKTSAISDETKRMMGLTAFGAGALPAAEAITSKIRTGRWMGGGSPKKWLLSQIPQALLWGAAFPMAGKLINRAVPMKKTGASKVIARLKGNLKVRQGRRPIRAETLLKKASQSGADLRIPLMGGTKFPTNDSLSSAKQKLKEHQDVAKPKMVRPTMQPVYGVSMPKLGSTFSDDPLVQYLKKTAAQVEDNEGDMKTGPVVQERVDADPEKFQRDTKTHSEWRQQLNELFSNTSGIKKKYTDKERSA